MKDIDLLKQILENQDLKWVESNDFDKMDYKIEEQCDSLDIIINNVQIGFCFNKEDGKLQGIFNWKY